MIVFGSLLVLVFGLIALGGAVVTWACATQRDAAGFFTTSDEHLDTSTYALTSEDLDLGSRPGGRGSHFAFGDLATVRFDVASVSGSDVFVGIGPEDEVAAYLGDVTHATIEDIDFDPFRVEYGLVEGSGQPSPPGDQDFWVASVEGPGEQHLEWEIDSGHWSVVVMNADAGQGVSVDASVGIKADWLLPLGIVLLVVGLLVVIGGAVLLVFGITGLTRHAAEDATAPPVPPSARPVRLTGHLDVPLSRWLWLVKWVLLIPHLVVLALLWVAVAAVSVVAWFAIVFTGRYPRSLFDFVVGVLRWSWRVSFYSYSALGSDRYPPFSLGPEPAYPATLEVDYPERLSQGLVWVKSWLLAIPQLLIVSILVGGGWRWGDDVGGRPGLLGVLVLVAGVMLLFTARYPKGLFDLIMGVNRWAVRTAAYVLLLRDEYPPFRLDQGSDEPVEAVETVED